MFEREYRDLSHVPRWSIIPVIKRQTVAEHSYYVALYASHILEAAAMHGADFPRAEIARVLSYALEHDRGECFTGDWPGPTKRSVIDPTKYEAYMRDEEARRFSTSAAPTPLAKAVIKLADLMDEYAYWAEEAKIGNTFFRQMALAIVPRLETASQRLGEFLGIDVEEHILVAFYEQTNALKVVPENNSDVASNR